MDSTFTDVRFVSMETYPEAHAYRFMQALWLFTADTAFLNRFLLLLIVPRNGSGRTDAPISQFPHHMATRPNNTLSSLLS